MSTTTRNRATDPAWALENTYAGLPDIFYSRTAPTPVRRPALVRFNHALAEELGLDARALTSEAGIQVLAGNRIPDGLEPIAMAYAGHQFGHFVPSLGDGRAVLLGEVVDRHGVRRDIQLKGAGRTPYSRSGDGRAVLGPVLREYVLGEAMHGLGIPSTRALAMVLTGEPVYREQVEPGAVLTRVAAGHVRVGTFEYFARRGDREAVRILADYVIRRHYPECTDAGNPYHALLEAVARTQGALIARWLLVGFIHGVMNTDNMAVTGETIDYGPCAFMDSLNPKQVYSSIDHHGRYAYDRQPGIGHWNLTQLADSLLPLLVGGERSAQETAEAALEVYARTCERSWRQGLGAKLGLADLEPEDEDLAMDLLGRMSAQAADFTNTFRRLCAVRFDDPAQDAPVRSLFSEPAAFDAWAVQWRARLARDAPGDERRRQRMRTVNPAYIPRNHRVQQAIEAATNEGDLEPMDRLLKVVSRPYDDHPELAEYANPPEPGEMVRQTFCGT
jgi:uncharacterized protein YdiU (UPF0061 family)